MATRKLWLSYPVQYCSRCGSKLFQSNLDKNILVCHKCNRTEGIKIKEEEIETDEYSLEDESSVKKVLKKLPAKIKEREEKIFSDEIKKGEYVSRNKTIRSDVARLVANETIEVEGKDGEKEVKKKYTNELQRESTLNVRLSNDNEFLINNNKADKLDKELSIARIELAYLKRLFRTAEALTRLGE